MELLLLFGLGVTAYVLWKRSRGEQPSAAGIAGGCLGLGCLGLVLTFVAGIALLWVILQALAGIDLSLSGFDFGGGGDGRDGGPLQVPDRET